MQSTNVTCASGHQHKFFTWQQIPNQCPRCAEEFTIETHVDCPIEEHVPEPYMFDRMQKYRLPWGNDRVTILLDTCIVKAPGGFRQKCSSLMAAENLARHMWIKLVQAYEKELMYSPECEDGCELDGFPGGCKRMGCHP